MNISPYILAVCLLTVPGDPEMSVELCRMAYDAKQRTVKIEDDWSDDKREWFLNRVEYMDLTGCEGRCL